MFSMPPATEQTSDHPHKSRVMVGLGIAVAFAANMQLFYVLHFHLVLIHRLDPINSLKTSFL